MEPIRILSHHAIHFFEVFYLGLPVENALSWYGNEKMKENGVKAVRAVVQNPETLVQIVDTYDETCRMCPKNARGDNYAQNPQYICTTYDDKTVSDKNFAKILGLESVLGGEPITAKTFFELMKPTYERLLHETEDDSKTKNLSLRHLFRSSRDMIVSLQITRFLSKPKYNNNFQNG